MHSLKSTVDFGGQRHTSNITCVCQFTFSILGSFSDTVKSHVIWWFNQVCNGLEIWTQTEVANSKVWWRTTDTLWVISDQNNLPTKCGFLVELSLTLQTSQDTLAPCSAKWSYSMVIWADVGVALEISPIWKPSENAKSIWFKPRENWED